MESRAQARAGDKESVGDEEIDIEKVPFPATVQGSDGEWLWLGEAWVRKADLMLTPEALEYYTDREKGTDRRQLLAGAGIDLAV